MSKSSFNHSNVDRVGVCVSAAWAVHCAIVPFGATTLPLLGIGFIADERIERINLPILDILDESSHRVPGHSGNDRQREPARVSNKVGLVNVTVKISCSLRCYGIVSLPVEPFPTRGPLKSRAGG